MKITTEMLEKAKSIEPVEELIRLAKEKEVDVTEEQIRKFYATNHKSGELSDDELNNVSGGRCYNDGRPVITVGEQHDCFVCKYCNNENMEKDFSIYCGHIHECPSNPFGALEVINNCGNCKWCIYEKGLWLCDNPEKRK